MFQKEITWNDSGFNLPPMIWLAAVGQPNVPAKVLPMDKLFSDSVNDQVDLNVWRCQVELFLRWVFNGDSKCREGLWKFVDVSSRQPVTEALFKQCFGFGYTEMEKKLMDFITRARGNYQGKRNVPITVVVNPIKLPSIVMRDATISEIARIKGSFDLRAIEFAKVNLRAKKLPSYIIDSCVDKYTDQAKVDLVGAYDQGVRDPAFLAVLGKYYAKVGDHAKARDFLGQAATAHVVLPSVYTELARICLSDALAKPTGSDGKLGSEQVKIIFDLLKESRNYGLSQFETLDIAKKVMNNSLVLSPDEKDFVEEEKMFFPQIPHIASFNRLTAEITQARSRIKTTN